MIVAATGVAGTALLGASLAAEPGSPRFLRLTAATAATWVAGGLAAGPVPRGRRSVLVPVLTGAAAFGAFYAGALVARRIPVLNRALASVLRHAGGGPVAFATLANGAAEEVFFRGALYAALGGRRSTAIYMLVTAATRNPALVLASGVMGALFTLQRRAAGGIQAPVLTHVTWSALMLRYLPPLFAEAPETNERSPSSSRSTSESST
ncbi:CPBP family intramembrane glutamic endopeptidase [Pseudonocardia nigra]|uniref:CPBP family intramembrane glutamic endopeptidase n=1 Tax=Pseudonocardia nigra TaxID=1921578 RepID=UPI001C5F912A|nr:CPBP family intramembrane glutamic endopeptidase [Pseudonocardia nigra]